MDKQSKDQKYRSKLKEDPVRYSLYLQKERLRRQKKKEAGKLPTIDQLSDRDKRQARKKWKNAQRKCRQRKVLLANELSPPPSPSTSVPHTSQKKTAGRKHVKREKTKSYRRIVELEEIVGDLEKKSKKTENKLRKRNERLKKRLKIEQKSTQKQHKKKTKESPESKTNKILKGSRVTKKVKREMLKYFTVINCLQRHIKRTTSQQEKKRIYKHFIQQNIVKRSNLKTQLQHDLRLYSRSSKPRKPHLKSVILAKRIRRFLSRADNSVVLPGKKQCITRKGVKKQKQLLIESMSFNYHKFTSENTHIKKISYSTFCRYRPFWVVAAKLSDRDTCMCKRHTNLQYMANKLYQNKVISTNNLHMLSETLCCSAKNKTCCYRKCGVCSSNKVPTMTFKSTDSVTYDSWEYGKVEYRKGGILHSTKRMLKVQKNSTLGHLLLIFNCEMKAAQSHFYNISHQFKVLHDLKKTLKPDEAVVHVDFSENFLCKSHEAPHAAHYGASQQQVALHTGIAYTYPSNYFSFCTMSDCTRHDPSAIWCHLDPILGHLSNSTPPIKTIHFVSDGPCTQYKNKSNFYICTTKLFEKYGIHNVTWSFLEAGHGKGPADGIGGAAKRVADTLVANNADIGNADELFTQLSKRDSKIKLFIIKPESIEEQDKELPPTSNIKTFPGTMRIHQMCSNYTIPGTGYFRDVSCFCSKPQICNCFDNTLFRITDLDMPTPIQLDSNGDSNDALEMTTDQPTPPTRRTLTRRPKRTTKRNDDMSNHDVTTNDLDTMSDLVNDNVGDINNVLNDLLDNVVEINNGNSDPKVSTQVHPTPVIQTPNSTDAIQVESTHVINNLLDKVVEILPNPTVSIPQTSNSTDSTQVLPNPTVPVVQTPNSTDAIQVESTHVINNLLDKVVEILPNPTVSIPQTSNSTDSTQVLPNPTVPMPQTPNSTDYTQVLPNPTVPMPQTPNSTDSTQVLPNPTVPMPQTPNSTDSTQVLPNPTVPMPQTPNSTDSTQVLPNPTVPMPQTPNSTDSTQVLPNPTVPVPQASNSTDSTHVLSKHNNRAPKKRKRKNTKQKVKRKKVQTQNRPTASGDYSCIICSEMYLMSVEDWLQCSECKGWAHEGCANPEGDNFTCDLCV